MSVQFWMRQGKTVGGRKLFDRTQKKIRSNQSLCRLYSLDTLINVCHTFMDRNAKDMLGHESFKNLSQVKGQSVFKHKKFTCNGSDVIEI